MLNGEKTHCPRGHPYDQENTIIRQRAAGEYRVCRECARARVRARNQTAEYREYMKAYLHEYGPRWRRENPEHARLLSQRWRKANPDRVRELRRQSETRPEARQRRADAQRKRDALKRGAFTEHVDRRVVFSADHGLCGICGQPCHPQRFDVDHIQPISRGGSHTYANCQPAHPLCNQRKHDH